jgi:hypothetical protein
MTGAESRRGVMAVPLVMGLAALLLAMGLSGAFTTSSLRHTLERCQARRQLDLVAASAVAEATARAEALLPGAPRLKTGETRNLSSVLSWKDRPGQTLGQARTLSLSATRAGLSGQISIQDVQFQASPFKVQARTKDSGPLVREYGVVELTVRLTVHTLFCTTRHRVLVRRFAVAVPAKDAARVRVRIQPDNLCWVVSEE